MISNPSTLYRRFGVLALILVLPTIVGAVDSWRPIGPADLALKAPVVEKDAVKLDAPFGSYKTTYAVKDGELVFTRALTQLATTIPAAQYLVIRSFFERMRAAEQAPVVLARK